MPLEMNPVQTVLHSHQKSGLNQLILSGLFQNQGDTVEHMHIKTSHLNLHHGLAQPSNFIK